MPLLMKEREDQKVSFKKGKAVVYYADMHLTIPEIAGKIDLPENEVKKILHHAGLFPRSL